MSDQVASESNRILGSLQLERQERPIAACGNHTKDRPQLRFRYESRSTLTLFRQAECHSYFRFEFLRRKENFMLSSPVGGLETRKDVCVSVSPTLGSFLGLYRLIGTPSRFTMNLVKFHLMKLQSFDTLLSLVRRRRLKMHKANRRRTFPACPVVSP